MIKVPIGHGYFYLIKFILNEILDKKGVVKEYINEHRKRIIGRR